jgi:U3 small nucleolar RNA-associated protein 7
MASAGRDGSVKVWDCRNWKGAVREWGTRGTGGTEVEWSARGFLGVASGGSVNVRFCFFHQNSYLPTPKVYHPPTIRTPHLHHSPPPLYLTHPLPSTSSRPVTSIRFTPFQDALTLGHSSGLSSILVPGSGEPNFDSSEADPFESKKARREHEVRALLDKIQPDMIALDPEFVGRLAPESKLTTRAEMLREKNSWEGQGGKGKKEGEVPFARMSRMERLRVAGNMDLSEVVGSDDEGAGGDEGGDGRRKESKEEREKRKMRGKGKSLKRYLRKQRKNVVDPAAVGFFLFFFLGFFSLCVLLRFGFSFLFPSYHISFVVLRGFCGC